MSFVKAASSSMSISPAPLGFNPGALLAFARWRKRVESSVFKWQGSRRVDSGFAPVTALSSGVTASASFGSSWVTSHHV
eukprot:6196400-Pleurochrysis_carterae.AAC.1